MTEKALKRLSRADLLEMLIDQSKELQEVREKLEKAEAELQKREIAIHNAGSIAEASLMLNGVFEAAQAACKEYVENTQKYCEAQRFAPAPGYDETPAYARPEPAPRPAGPSEYSGMPYAQYLQQNVQPNPYVRPQPESAKAGVMQRTSRYLGTLGDIKPK